MTYGKDLRQRAVWFVKREKLSFSATGRRLRVGRRWVSQVIAEYESSGSTQPPPPKRTEHADRAVHGLVALLIERAVEDEPTIYLRELKALLWRQLHVDLSESQICRDLEVWGSFLQLFPLVCVFPTSPFCVLQRMGFHRRKGSLVAREADPDVEHNWWRVVGDLPASLFVFLDETSSDVRRVRRTYGRARGRGKRARIPGFFVRGQRYAAMHRFSELRLGCFACGDSFDHSVVDYEV